MFEGLGEVSRHSAALRFGRVGSPPRPRPPDEWEQHVAVGRLYQSSRTNATPSTKLGRSFPQTVLGAIPEQKHKNPEPTYTEKSVKPFLYIYA